jgi:quercetin dioxygenase-like cupin family protein
MSYKALDANEIPYTWGTFKFVRHHLGGSAFGINQIDFPADKEGPEHDEATSLQEEIYYTISGSGWLIIDGETVEMKAGRYILVSPEAKRRPKSGPDGMSFMVIGGIPGGVYVPSEPPAE